MPDPAGVHSGSPLVVGSQCMLAPQPGPGLSGSQSVVPPPVLEELVVLEELELEELEELVAPVVVVELLALLLELAPPWPAEVLVPLPEVLEPLPLLEPAPPAPIVTFVAPEGSEPLPPLPSTMLVPSAQAVDSATRVASPSV